MATILIPAASVAFMSVAGLKLNKVYEHIEDVNNPAQGCRPWIPTSSAGRDIEALKEKNDEEYKVVERGEQTAASDDASIVIWQKESK